LLVARSEVPVAQQSRGDSYWIRLAQSAVPVCDVLGSGAGGARALGGSVLGGTVLIAGVLIAGVLMGCGGGARSEAAAASGTDDVGELSAADPLPDTPVSTDSDEAATEPISTPNLPPPAPEDVSVQLTGELFPIGSSQGLVSGALYLVNSPLGTSIELTEATGRLCVRGELDVVPGGDYASYWGSEVGLVLVSNAAAEAPAAEALDTPGFAFRLEGALPLQLRFRVGAAGEVPLVSQYCQEVPRATGTSIEVPLEALTHECWLFGGKPFPSASGATLISWQMPANEMAADGFDFCIEDLRTL
jgi:hypothetical protein